MMIAYCGLNCGTCPIHLATLEQYISRQQEMRISIARQCREQYGMDLQPDDITDCDGCHANAGRVFPGCRECRIRKCASLKGVKNCAFCSDYACELLTEFFTRDPEAKTRLEEIRSETGS